MNTQKDEYKTSRILYIIEAALEYFISILITGAYLAKITSSLGISDSLTGILTSFVSLGCGFQLFSIFFVRQSKVKRKIVIFHSINQLFFVLIYLVPFINLSKEIKIGLFIVFLLFGHIINNVINSPKINWYMSLVDNNKRGRFTANKEMVSLMGGMIFTFIMGSVIDYFEDMNNITGSFIVLGISVFILMILHSLTLIFSKEQEVENNEKASTKETLLKLIKDKKLFKIILIPILWNIVNYVAIPFYGSYQIKELGFTMKYVSILSIIYAITRTLFSGPLGKYADKYSFTKMLNICFAVMLIAYSINIFTVPENGKILYTIYYVLYAIGMAGINSSTINLIYDYVSEENRVGALAISGSLSGFAGFFITLLVSPLVEYIQNNNNIFLGINVYAQQVVSFFAVIILVSLIIYLNVIVKKIEKN